MDVFRQTAPELDLVEMRRCPYPATCAAGILEGNGEKSSGSPVGALVYFDMTSSSGSLRTLNFEPAAAALVFITSSSRRIKAVAAADRYGKVLMVKILLPGESSLSSL